MNEQPGSASVVQSVSSSLNGIGYSGIGYKTSGVKSVPLAKKHPNKPLAPLEREFIKLVLSKVG